MPLNALLGLHGEAFVSAAYRSVLGREPDVTGLSTYVGRLSAGDSRSSVLHDIAQSEEGKARVSCKDLYGLTDEAFVDAVYRRLLCRAPDSHGRKNYLDLLGAGVSRGKVVEGIRNSAEARGSNSPELRFRADLESFVKHERTRRGWRRWFDRTSQVNQRIGQLEFSTAHSLDRIESVLRQLDGKLNAFGETLSSFSANPPISSGPPTIPAAGFAGIVPQGIATSKSRLRILSPVEGTLYLYVDHTVRCPVNTGMQRVARQLARSLVSLGAKVVFVKWQDDLKRLVMVNHADLVHLAEWGGPHFSASQIADAGYPANGEDAVIVEGTDLNDRNWLVIPEVTHINFHGRQLTLDVILAARRACLRTAFVFYDAIPLRRKELSAMAPWHEAYMRQLLHADLILPISQSSGRDFTDFLTQYELVGRHFLPAIETLLLPAEVSGQERISVLESPARRSRKILCVGSIEERKNQLAAVRAFADLASNGLASGWCLDLIGNCSADLYGELSKLTNSCPAIAWRGNSSDAELKRAYAECSFTVFPSFDEGFGLPIAESLWYGRPCLCANFGSMAEIAAGGGCYTVDTRDQRALTRGMQTLMQDDVRRDELGREAASRRLETWAEYGTGIGQRLSVWDNPLPRLGRIYYVADHSSRYPHNTGIQRVTRGLAAALQRQGLHLIAARWNEEKTALVPLEPQDLKHLEQWNGPSFEGWGAWEEPDARAIGGWVLMPELTPHYAPEAYVNMRKYLDGHQMRGCWIFYDTIPWKLRDIYPPAALEGHANYMAGLNLFELILPISHYSRKQLEMFYLGQAEATVDLAHRLVACPLPGEFQEIPRVMAPKTARSGPIRILSVGTLEPRKNHRVLVRAFLIAKRASARPMRLTLAGGAGPDPELVAEISALIAENPDIQWVRDPDDPDLNRMYEECDFTVYPSYEEGFGLPILESLWHARPCICMNAGAMEEVGSGGGCALVDTTSEHELAAAIREMANDDRRREKLALEAVHRQFRTWDDYGSDVALHMAEERTLPEAADAVPESAGTMGNIHEAMGNIHPRPILSVCISTYNRAKWLSLSLAVLAREAEPLRGKVEVLVCDNASTDNTPEIVGPFLAQGVRYERNAENVGMLGNLRVTAQEARGQFVWILGDDDILMPGAIQRVLEVIETHPELALVYLNYAYTKEDSPETIGSLQQFLGSATPIADGGKSFRGAVREVAVRNENFFTAIYCVVFQRSHALLAYSQFTEGEPFSSLPTCVPTTNHVLHRMMDLPAYWVAEPQVVINMNVSWLRYAWRWILEIFPEIFDTAVRYGAAQTQVDAWRDNHLPSVEHFVDEILSQTDTEIYKSFNFAKLIASIKHTSRYQAHRPRFEDSYRAAFNAGHPLATQPPESIFRENRPLAKVQR